MNLTAVQCNHHLKENGWYNNTNSLPDATHAVITLGTSTSNKSSAIITEQLLHSKAELASDNKMET